MLDTQKELSRLLDKLLDLHEKADALPTIDHAVVVGERNVHHWSNNDLVIDDDRPFLDRMHTEDSSLRRAGHRSDLAEMARFAAADALMDICRSETGNLFAVVNFQ